MTPNDLYATTDTTPRLSMRAELSLYDDQGRCRCPCCGKFRRREDIPDQKTAATLPGMTISLLPRCRVCLGKATKTDDFDSGGVDA